MAALLLLTAAATLGGLATHASAADRYPVNPIRLVVPTPAGSFTDLTARIVSDRMARDLGQPFIAENRAGASTNIGTQVVAHAANNGYTLLFATNSNTMNVSLFTHLQFDIVKDFEPVALAATSSFILVVNPALPVSNLQELIAYAKQHPGELNFASTGEGSANHLAGKMLEEQAHLKVAHIFYKGSTEGITDVLAGRVQAMFSPPTSALPFVADGTLKAIAYSGAARSALAPQLPTMAEAGLPGYQIGVWLGFLAPAGTPADIVKKLGEAVTGALKAPDVLERLKTIGADPAAMGPDEFSAFMKKDIAMWAQAYREAGIKPVD